MSKFDIGNGSIWLGDCLELMREIPDSSVDMVLCDLPYGTTACKWDQVIPFEPLWEQYWRVCKPNAAVVLTASQPFTSALVMSQVDKFKYEWIWEKSKASNFLQARKQVLKAHENVMVFSNSVTVYNPQMIVGKAFKGEGRSKKGAEWDGVNSVPNPTFRHDNKGVRFPRSVQYFKTAESEGKKQSWHPTQKPVALFEYLIKTYTDEGMTVLDNCSGSGTTAVAAERSGRRWIAIEKDPEYYIKSVGRLCGEVQQ